MAVVEQRIDTATVLFTDVVGSTAMRARLGEEAADVLRVIHDDLMRAAIVAQRGTVVKHTGDGVMATFSAAVDAVSASIAIQQAVDAHNRRSDQERFEVRVGISVGDVTFDEHDCFGLPVIEAQRLEAAAEGGQILCAEIVRHLARGRGGHEFTSVGDLELKGIPDPVPAARVHWSPVVHVAMARETPLPPVLSAPSAFDLAGRAAELDVLVDAWKESADGRSRVVLISGEPGIGKTRLATETALTARRQGALVIAGRCDEELGLPYQPFVEALRFQVGLGDDVPPEWLGPLADELTRLVPELPERVAGVAMPARTDPESERAQLFEAVTAWLRTTAASVPLMLVLDDLHWADRPTLLLLRHLLHETTGDSILIVGTYRSTDLDRSHPLSGMLADLRRDSHVTRLAVDGLTADGVAELLERAAGHGLDPAGVELASAIFAETAGNPFFVGEIMRHLVESGALVQRDGRWTSDFTLADVGLPEGVREVVGRRISRLDEPAQRALSTAAVVGHEFAVPVLAAVLGTDEDAVIDLLDTARAAGLVNEVGLDRYRFGHALVRATLLEELTTSRRVRTHRKIGEAIEARHHDNLDAVVTDLAYHFGEAAAADPEKAVRYAALAGDHAYASSAADDAVRWYEFARDHLEDTADVTVEVDLLTRLARAEWVSGLGDARTHLREAARLAKEVGLHEAMVEALLVSVRTSFDEGQESDPEKIELLEAALGSLDDAPALRARALGALAVELIFVGDMTRRGPMLDEARALARSCGDLQALVEVETCHFNARPRSTWSAVEFALDRALLDEAAAAAAALGDGAWLATMQLFNAFYAFVVGDGEQLRTHAAALAETSAGGRNNLALRGSLLIEQMIAAVDGRLLEAKALSVEQFEVWQNTSPAEAFTYRAVETVVIRREQGRLGESIPAWTEFVLGQPRAGAAAGVVAFALAEAGRLDDAAARVHEASSDRFRDVPDEAGWPFAIAMWTEAAVRVADRDAAAALHELVVPLDGIHLATGGIMCGPAARLLAMLEHVLDRPADIDRHFGEAVEISRRLMSPVWLARSRLDWAENLASRGERARARQLVDEADATIGSLPLPALQQQSARLREQLAAG